MYCLSNMANTIRTEASTARATRPKPAAGSLGTAIITRLLPLLLLLALPAVARAQYNFTVSNSAVTITGYTGPGGAVAIPSTILVSSVFLPVTTIGDWAFYKATSVTSVTIPTSVTRIGTYVFYYCTNLVSITIPNSVTSIGAEVFFHCASLTSVALPTSLTIVANGTFDYCASLTNVTIPNGVFNIGSGVFNNCTSLTTLTIPGTVSSIGYDAFYSCTNLTGVYFKGNTPALGSSAFAFDNNAIVYYLPATTGWSSTYGGCPTVPWQPRVQTSDGTLGVRTNRFGFTIAWTSGTTVVVEASTNLASHIWTAVGTNSLTTDSSYFSDSHWTNYPRRFYRLRSP
jgi:hypothetical protein